MKKYITDIIGDSYLDWKKGNTIFINAGTGAGKSYFIKNKLVEHCEKNNKRILLLTNRNNLKEQCKAEIGESKTITIINYQAIENLLLKNVTLANYNYVVCDECHYFFSDAYTMKTDLFFDWMLENNDTCKILMTATPEYVLKYFKDNKINVTKQYKVERNYDYIEKMYAFEDDETVEEIIQNVPDGEKIIYFGSNKEKVFNIAKKFDGAFICSDSNKARGKNYIKYIDTDERDNIIKNATFNKKLLCTTTCLDNGVNIKEGVPVKHIIIDIFDFEEFIQCLGRKRVGEGETVTLYFKNYKNKKQLVAFKKRLENQLIRAKVLLAYGEEEYVKYSFKNSIFHTTDAKMIDNYWSEEKQCTTLRVNKCMYAKYQTDLYLIDNILNEDTCFRRMITNKLEKQITDITDIEKTKKENELVTYLDSIVGKKLYKEERKELKEIFKENGTTSRTMGAKMLNGDLAEKKLPYVINADDTNVNWDRKLSNGETNPYRGKKYWIVGKITY